jgi:hypothetical protein
VAPVPSRFTCALPLPRRGRFHAFLALAAPAGAPEASARFRIGISDGRVYEGLTEKVLTTGADRWIDIETDLSAYAGWKWSLFYRPDRITWRLVLAADALSGAPSAVWGQPEILSDSPAAREYLVRAQGSR